MSNNEIHLTTKPIIGWRYWRRDADGTVMSLTQDYRWNSSWICLPIDASLIGPEDFHLLYDYNRDGHTSCYHQKFYYQEQIDQVVLFVVPFNSCPVKTQREFRIRDLMTDNGNKNAGIRWVYLDAKTLKPLVPGFFAWKSQENARRDNKRIGVVLSKGESIVEGPVLLQGTVYKHEFGYRAEMAKIPSINDLRIAYDCPFIEIEKTYEGG